MDPKVGKAKGSPVSAGQPLQHCSGLSLLSAMFFFIVQVTRHMPFHISAAALDCVIRPDEMCRGNNTPAELKSICLLIAHVRTCSRLGLAGDRGYIHSCT